MFGEHQISNQLSSVQGKPSPATRRFFVGSLASLGAGLAGSALLLKPAEAESATSSATPPVKHAPGSQGCQSEVISSDFSTVAETTAGKIRGFRRNRVYTFKGVPYGASTSGAMRFMPPAKPEPWPGIRNALQYGRVCPAHDSMHSNMDGKNLANSDEDQFVLHRGAAASVPGEDCLRVNVWTPEINGSNGRPVMVYMHGGGFSGGDGHELLAYNGESLARNHDVVAVTHNHRLNVFGYLNLAELGGEEYASSANAGLLDLVAVLEWVRDNIAKFGGNPQNVTIFGQSGGGGKVLALMAMPSAQGLFHRAIIQSGPYLKMLFPEYSTQLAVLVMRELGFSKSQVDELQRVSVDRLEGAAAEALKKMPAPVQSPLRRTFGENGWGPTVGNHILPNHPFDPRAPELSADVPLLTGSNLNEFVNGLDHPRANAMEAEELNRLVQEAFGGRGKAIIDAYRSTYPKASPFGLYAAIAAAPVRHIAFEQASRKAALKAAPAYAYIYSWRTPVLDDRPGTFHAAEIAFVFDNAEICDHYSAGAPDAFALSTQMSRTWVNFARTGNPNHDGLPFWPAFTAEERAVMDFNTISRVRGDPESEGLRLIAQS